MTIYENINLINSQSKELIAAANKVGYKSELLEILKNPQTQYKGNEERVRIIQGVARELEERATLIKNKRSEIESELSAIPLTESDKTFFDKHKKNKNIQWNKIYYTQAVIMIDDLPIPRSLITYHDIQEIPGLAFDKNIRQAKYKEELYEYFKFNAVENLIKAGERIPTQSDRQQSADVFGGDFGLLGQLLAYPKLGKLSSNENGTGQTSQTILWSSTPAASNHAHCVSFSVRGKGESYLQTKNDACSLIILPF